MPIDDGREESSGRVPAPIVCLNTANGAGDTIIIGVTVRLAFQFAPGTCFERN